MTRNNMKHKLEFIQDATVNFKTTSLHLILMGNFFFSKLLPDDCSMPEFIHTWFQVYMESRAAKKDEDTNAYELIYLKQ